MTKEEIKDNYSMRDIAVRYDFQPNRTGFIPCPFHQGDRQASLKLYDKDFHCHACGVNGDIFTFVQMMDNLSFSDAFFMLGGTYEHENRFVVRSRILKLKQKRIQEAIENAAFKQWRNKRLNEVCRLLRMLDKLLPQIESGTEEWSVAINMRQITEYKYSILASGTREEQEAMRKLDE